MNHEQASPLVSDWIRGRLDGARAAAVEEHALACADCRAAAEGARALVAEAESLAGAAREHPASDLLARYVSMPGAESIADLARVGAHLRGCANCRDDAALMREAAAPAGWRGARAWLASLFPLPRPLQPVLALAALLLLFPAWTGLVTAPRERAESEQRVRAAEQGRERAETQAREFAARPAAPAGGGVATLILTGASRSASATPELRPRPGQALQPVLLDVVPPAGSLTVRVARADGSLAWTASGARDEFWDETNRVVGLLVPAAALAPGEYRVTLLSGAAGTPLFSAGFRILPPR